MLVRTLVTIVCGDHNIMANFCSFGWSMGQSGAYVLLGVILGLSVLSGETHLVWCGMG